MKVIPTQGRRALALADGALKGMIVLKLSLSYILEDYECQAKKLRLFPLR